MNKKQILTQLIKEEIKNILVVELKKETFKSSTLNEGIFSDLNKNIAMLPPMAGGHLSDLGALRRAQRNPHIPNIRKHPETPEAKMADSPLDLIISRSEIIKAIFPTLFARYKNEENLIKQWFKNLYSEDKDAIKLLNKDLQNYINNPSYLESRDLQKVLSLLHNLEDPEKGIDLDKVYGDKIAQIIKNMESKEKERLKEIKILKEFIKNIISRKLKLI